MLNVSSLRMSIEKSNGVGSEICFSAMTSCLRIFQYSNLCRLELEKPDVAAEVYSKPLNRGEAFTPNEVAVRRLAFLHALASAPAT